MSRRVPLIRSLGHGRRCAEPSGRVHRTPGIAPERELEAVVALDASAGTLVRSGLGGPPGSSGMATAILAAVRTPVAASS